MTARRAPRRIVKILGIILGLCVLVGIVGLLNQDDQATTPAPTATIKSERSATPAATETATITPTATDEPTATSEPTATREPTATDEPTATSEPTATIAMQPAPATVAPASRAGAVAGSNPGAFTCIGGCAVAPDPSCAIKGNVNSEGKKIYHEPGWRDYKKTNVKPEEGDRWFCTAEEARAAGFRAAQQ